MGAALALRLVQPLGQPQVGFRMTIEGAKALFFDRDAVKSALDAANRRVLSRFGYFVMRDARQSIRRPPRRRRDKGSNAGRPPYNQTGLLKRFIFFSYDAGRRSVVIGPTLLEGHIRFLQIPRVLEEGGVSRHTFRVRDASRPGRTKTVYGERVFIAARPYMRPAFERQKERQMPQLWQNAIRG